MKPVGFALVGCGAAGKRHLRSLTAIRRFARVVAACDVSEEVRKEVGKELNIPAFACYSEMLQAPDVEVVDICAPPGEHKKLALEAMDAGKSVFCEKPLASTSADAEAICGKSKSAKVLLGAGLCHRFHPGVRILKKVIESGRIGRILMFRSRFSNLTNGNASGNKNGARRKASGGGNLWDMGIHSIDLVRFLVGEFRNTWPVLKTYDGKHCRGVEDSYIISFETTKDVIGTIEGSWVSPYAQECLEVYGARGSAVYNYNDDKLVVHTAAGPSYPKIPPGDRFASELKAFAQAVRKEGKLEVTGDDAVKAIRVVEGILKAGRGKSKTRGAKTVKAARKRGSRR